MKILVFGKKKKNEVPRSSGPLADCIVTLVDNVWAAFDPFNKRQPIHFANLLPELT